MAAEQSKVDAGVVRLMPLWRDAVFEAGPQVEQGSQHWQQRLPYHGDVAQYFGRPKTAEHGGPSERANHRAELHQAEAGSLNLTAQPFGRPSTVIVRVRMVEPSAVSREEQPTSRL